MVLAARMRELWLPAVGYGAGLAAVDLGPARVLSLGEVREHPDDREPLVAVRSLDLPTTNVFVCGVRADLTDHRGQPLEIREGLLRVADEDVDVGRNVTILGRHVGATIDEPMGRQCFFLESCSDCLFSISVHRTIPQN